MIRDPKAWKEWEKFQNDRIRKEKVDVAANVKLFEAMALEAQDLGVFPPSNPLEGIEYKLRLVRILNALPKHS